MKFYFRLEMGIFGYASQLAYKEKNMRAFGMGTRSLIMISMLPEMYVYSRIPLNRLEILSFTCSIRQIS